jgi:hypothetical protein
LVPEEPVLGDRSWILGFFLASNSFVLLLLSCCAYGLINNGKACLGKSRLVKVKINLLPHRRTNDGSVSTSRFSFGGVFFFSFLLFRSCTVRTAEPPGDHDTNSRKRLFVARLNCNSW